jgi:hypothetical protein
MCLQQLCVTQGFFPPQQEYTLKGNGHQIEFKYLDKNNYKCSSDEMSSLPFPTRFWLKPMVEILFIGETSTEFFLRFLSLLIGSLAISSFF